MVNEQPARRWWGSPTRPGLLHRCLAIVAAIMLLNNLRAQFVDSFQQYSAFALVTAVCCGLALVLAVLAATASTTRRMRLVDAGIFLVALTEVLTSARLRLIAGQGTVGDDVGMVLESGTRAILDGHHLYGVHYPEAFNQYASTGTLVATALSDGSTVTDFGYPPMGALLSAALTPLAHGAPASAIASYLGMITAGVLMFFLLPAPMRPAAALTCFLFPRIQTYVDLSYPALMALPLLIAAVWAWPTIGAAGRLGPRGVVSAVCLGLAVSTHQLAWFVALFVTVGIWLVRRGHLPTGATNLLLLRYIGLGGATFALVNAWFIAQDPAAWLHGITEPLTQQAVPAGLGIVTFVTYLGDGSGNMAAFGNASLAMLAGLLLIFALYVRRLGPAATILPWLAFWFATRSQDAYYVLLAPLWVVGVATLVHRRWFVQAHQLRLPLPAWGQRAWARATAAAVLPALAVALVGVAIATPAPLRMTQTAVATNPNGMVWQVRTTVTNTSDGPLTPHFALTAGHALVAQYWTVTAGPATLQPGQTAEYTLVTPNANAGVPDAPRPFYLRAVTAEPFTMSNERLDSFARDCAAVDTELASEPTRCGAVIIGAAYEPTRAPGQPYEAVIQVRDPAGRDLREAGVPIRLTGQWASTAESIDDEITVNGAYFTDGAWTAQTDANGQVKISLVSPKALPEPVMFRTTTPRSINTVMLFWRH
jgi:hypothetical protein